jgi:fatty-acyl-CoA synthase
MSERDAFAPVVEAGPNRWLGGWSERRARLSPERVGLVDATTGRKFSYAELDGRANQVARLLRENGVEDGARVAVVTRNRPELVDLFFATAKTGGVLAPLSHRLAPRELAELLSTVDAELLVVEDPFVEPVAEAVEREEYEAEPSLLRLTGDDIDDGDDGDDIDDGDDGDKIGDTDGDEADGDSDATDDDPVHLRAAQRFDAARPADDSPVDRADLSMDDPHLFLHTGGSTGTPKETVVTHGGVLWNSFNTITAWGLRPEDVTPMVFPMFHTGGWNVVTVPLFHLGGTVIIARDFDPAEVLHLVPEYDASVLVAVPAVLRMMASHEDWETTDLSSLRFAKSGGGPCRESVMQAWWDRGIDLSQGYGLTECGPNNFAMPEGWPHEKADSVGVPAMHVDARVVDDDGAELDAGDVGELELSGPHAAREYWEAPEETADTFGGGWVSTGDLARVDEDGYYHVEGRKKNMFVSGGENVYPPEVEDAVAAHPKVEEVVVVGVPDETWGTVGRAVVEGDESLTLEELTSFLDGRLARFKHPASVVFVDEMPTSGPSKIDRTALKDRFGGE